MVRTKEAKYTFDPEKLKEVLRKETPVAQIVKEFGYDKEARPALYIAIKRLAKTAKVEKVKPGVFKLVE